MAPRAHPGTPAGFAPAFVARLLDDALVREVRILGIAGLQGSGKSTLAAQLAGAASARGLRAVALSIDDLYLDRPERERLARDVHPLLATRGPPGTHDAALGCAVLDALRDGHRVRLPAFDKPGDRRLPESQWRQAGDIDLAVFEGWCLGTPPEPDASLAAPVNALERDEDPDEGWRRFCNAALARDYPALWRRIDRLLFLQPPSFDIVPEWRWQQECALMKAGARQAADPSRAAMTRAQLERFVQHFERISRQALRTLPAIADAVVALDAQRRPAGAGSGRLP